MTAGRPTDFREEYCDQAYRMGLLGCTDKEMADFFGVCEATINNWKIDYPQFLESLKNGKENADQEIAKSLYLKAKDGDTTAMIFWLKNRRKHHWRDKQDHEVTGKDGGPIETNFTVNFVKSVKTQ